ncbi:MAG: hypothetical protein U0P30_16390 [Vicinamibacterales bacterium]
MTAARVAAALALALSLAFGLAAWSWRTGAVGGSDSSCYALMTRAYVEGRAQPDSALAREAPWPDATVVAAPGGFLPAPDRPGAAAPVCAPGYSLLVAPVAWAAGLAAIHVVPPIAAALVVWCAWLLGARLGSPWAGVGAALLTATHPIVWFQAVQPMNDITTAALWLGATVAALDRRAWTTGALVGLGLVVRPNLAPAAVAITLVCVWLSSRDIREAAAVFGRVCLAAAPGVAIVLWLNAVLYGSPARSGYGDLGVLFSMANVPVNLARYGATWIATGTPVVLLALIAPFVAAPAHRGRSWALAIIASALSVVYLAYRPFPEWWYLRFLLPAVVLGLTMTSAALLTLGERVAGRAGVGVALAVLLAVAVVTARSPQAAEARGLWRLESRFTTTAEAMTTNVPATSPAITGWQSGPIRFGPGHEVLMWDALDPAWLDRAIAWLGERGTPPVIVLETWEEAPFRTRFAGQVYGALDWPPSYDVERRVHIYVPADRARFLAGETVPTTPVFAKRRADLR